MPLRPTPRLSPGLPSTHLGVCLVTAPTSIQIMTPHSEESANPPTLSVRNSLVNRMAWLMGTKEARADGSSTAIYLPLLYTLGVHSRGTIVECGVRTGVTTVPLLAAAWERKTTLTSIDIASCRAEALITLGFDEGAPKLDHWTFIQGDNAQVASKFPDGEVGLWFLDAGHRFRETEAELAAWLPKMRADGIMCGHDWNLCDDKFGVRRAVRRFHRIPEVRDRFKLTCFSASYGFFILFPRAA